MLPSQTSSTAACSNKKMDKEAFDALLFTMPARLAPKLETLDDEDKERGVLYHIHANGLCMKIFKHSTRPIYLAYCHDGEDNHFNTGHMVPEATTEAPTIESIVQQLVDQAVAMQMVAYMQQAQEQRSAGYNVCH